MTARPYRILVTGSRDWEDGRSLHGALVDLWRTAAQSGPLVIVHGACPTGADAHAAYWVWGHRVLGDPIREERHPADWTAHGRGAGPVRNRAMVTAGADVCLAFIRNGSRGATGCAALAEAAGIPVRRWTA